MCAVSVDVVSRALQDKRDAVILDFLRKREQEGKQNKQECADAHTQAVWLYVVCLLDGYVRFIILSIIHQMFLPRFVDVSDRSSLH